MDNHFLSNSLSSETFFFIWSSSVSIWFRMTSGFSRSNDGVIQAADLWIFTNYKRSRCTSIHEKMVVGRIVRVPLREVWKHEALDFTRWLQENVDLLNDILDLNLVSAEGEQSAGDFSVDLVAEDEKGNTAVIENQLEKSDHEHLGKIITYMTALGSKTAIWIVADARPEHISAITWLNESASASFIC